MADWEYGLTSGAAAAEIMTTSEAKAWLRVDHSAEDTLIDELVVAVREEVESWLNATLINTTHTLVFDCWPSNGIIYLPRGPVSSVTSISYLDGNGDSQTWASSNYVVDTSTPSPRIGRADGVTWPTLDNRIANVTIVYVAGYGATSASVPSSILIAAKLLLADFYENRQAQTSANLNQNKTAKRLLDRFRNYNPMIGAY